MNHPLLRLFRIRRYEWLPLAVLCALVIEVNFRVIAHYWPMFHVFEDNVWGPFPHNFHVSGFDALLYSMSSHWNVFYNICMRHPLLAYLLLPTFVLTRVTYWLTGYNCVQIYLGIQLVACATYGLLMLYRTIHYVIRVPRWEAWLLTSLCLSFGMVLLSTAMPDHFIFSFFLLTLTLFVSGWSLRRKRPLTTGQTAALFLLTAGVTLTNGVKTLIAQLIVNGKRMFRPRNVLSLLLCVAALYAVMQITYKTVTLPDEQHRLHQRQIADQQHAAGRQTQEANQAKTATLVAKTSSAKDDKADNRSKTATAKGNKDEKTAASQLFFMKWVDTTTDRWQSLRDNVFGETFQLHSQHLLQDVGMGRPVFVSYDGGLQNAVEIVIVLLFVIGTCCGLRDRFWLMCLSWLLFDAVVHLGFGFGLNEVYIMACHWAFLVPIALAYLYRRLPSSFHGTFGFIIFLLTLYLFKYNGHLIVTYLS